MDDRITVKEILVAVNGLRYELEHKLSITEKEYLRVVIEAVQAYVDLVDGATLIIRRDENGDWPEAVVTRIAFSLASFQLRRGIVPGDKQGAISLLDALASSQGVEPQ